MEPIRVLQINNDMRLGGAETLIMNIYRNIDRTKVQFDFLLHNPEKTAYEDEILRMGGRIYKIPRYLGYNSFSYKKHLTHFLEEHPEYQIIHNHLLDSASKTLSIANKNGRTSIAHCHTANHPFSIEEMIRFLFRRNLWKIADHRLACSKIAGDWLYRGKADFTIVRNGIKTSNYCFSEKIREEIRKEFSISDESILIGSVGRLAPEKNHLRLLEIFKTITTTNPNSVLILVGDGPNREQIEKKISELKLGNKVILTGARQDVNKLLMAMDCFVLTSVCEGFGIVLIEAQASGLPCVFSDIVPEEVELIPQLLHRKSLSASNEEWAETISGLKPILNRSIAWEKIKDSGFDIQETANQIQDFYLSIMKCKTHSDASKSE